MNHFIEYAIEKRLPAMQYLLWILEDSGRRFSLEEGHNHFNARLLGCELKTLFSKRGIEYRFVSAGYHFNNNSVNSIICTPAKGNVRDLIRHIRNTIVHNTFKVVSISNQEYVKAIDAKGCQTAFICVPMNSFKMILKIISSYS